MKEAIKELVIKALKEEGLPGQGIESSLDFVVEHPADLSRGDYSTNAALAYAKTLKKNPAELGKMLVERISTELPEVISKVEAIGGFINFHLSPQFFADSIKDIIEGRNDGTTRSLEGKKFFVEHTQPNPFKIFHIGHLMNNAIGEALSRLLEKNGATIKKATYHGDVGLHVAKGIYSLLKSGEKITSASLGEAYVLGNAAYEEDEEAKKEIVEINKKIYAKTDETINALYEEGRRVSFDQFESMYARLGSSFDFHFYESEAGEIGKEVVAKNVGTIFKESEGAVIFPGEDYGLHTRVFLNREGLPTYEAKEVGLAEIKKEKFAYDQSLTITANEQNDFFNVVEVAIGKVFPDLEGKLEHLSHGVLRLTTGKMSSRSGGIIPAETMIDDIKASVKEKMTEADRGLSPEETEIVSEQVAIGALKYWILRQSIGKDIIFDKEKSLSFEGDSGPYLQYAHTRAESVLRKAKAEGISINPQVVSVFEQRSAEELVIKSLYRFPEIIEEASSLRAPQQLVTYLTELAAAFNGFYANTPILNKEDPATSSFRLALVSAFATVMKNGLTVLGIPVPEKM